MTVVVENTYDTLDMGLVNITQVALELIDIGIVDVCAIEWQQLSYWTRPTTDPAAGVSIHLRYPKDRRTVTEHFNLTTRDIYGDGKPHIYLATYGKWCGVNIRAYSTADELDFPHEEE